MWVQVVVACKNTYSSPFFFTIKKKERKTSVHPLFFSETTEEKMSVGVHPTAALCMHHCPKRAAWAQAGQGSCWWLMRRTNNAPSPILDKPTRVIIVAGVSSGTDLQRFDSGSSDTCGRWKGARGRDEAVTLGPRARQYAAVKGKAMRGQRRHFIENKEKCRQYSTPTICSLDAEWTWSPD